MVSLGETYDGGPRLDDRRRLYLGTGLLLVGAFIAAIGFASVAADALSGAGLPHLRAQQAAIGLTGVLVPTVFAGSVIFLSAGRPIRLAAGAGVVVSVMSVALFLFTVPAEALAPPVEVPVAIAALYAVGAAVAVWSPIGAAAAAVIDRDQGAATTHPTAVRRSTDTPGGQGPMSSGGVPADGGSEEDDLEFLLDDEEREP